MALVRHQRSTARSPSDAAWSLAKLSSMITIIGALLGGFWVLFLFIYSKYVEPQLTPAIVQASTEAVHVGSTNCCYLFEIATRIENKGHRNTVIHASHQVVGARRLSVPDELSPTSVKRLTQSFLESRSLMNDPSYIAEPIVEYVGIKADFPFLIISAGNLTKPEGQLAPGEHYISRTVAAVPKDHLIMSIRGTLFVSHFERADLDWRWTLKETTLEPLPMPWRRSDSKTLSRLTGCATQGETQAERRQCLLQIINGANKVFRESWLQDSHSYSQHYAVDLFAVPKPKPEKQ